jgi:hypothetical protein
MRQGPSQGLVLAGLWPSPYDRHLTLWPSSTKQLGISWFIESTRRQAKLTIIRTFSEDNKEQSLFNNPFVDST